MRINTRDLKNGRPTHCPACGTPLGAQCWRSSSGRLYCSEFCSDDGEAFLTERNKHLGELQ